MIKIFSPTDKNYVSNGDVVITPTKARIKNADNGDYYLELTCNIGYNAYIQANNIIVAPTPQGEQAFRIKDITKSQNNLKVKAWHVFYDANNYVIEDSYAVDLTCEEAMLHFNAATDNTSPFTMHSNIDTVNSYRCVRTSLTECLNTILERWGGHLVRNNWDISINSSVSVDNGITIEYKKNLQSLSAEYNWDNVVTKLLPVGKDGTLLDNIYVESQTQYDIPYTKVVSFSQDNINQDDYPTEADYIQALKDDLYNQAVQYLEINCIPSINYKLKGMPEKVTDIGDIIKVKDERIGIEVLTQVIAYEYDCITGRYNSLEFGNFTNNLNDLLSNINNDTTNIVSNAVSGITDNTNRILSLLKDGYVVYRQNDVIIIDSKPDTTATNVIKIDNNGVALSKTGVNGTYNLIYDINGKIIVNNNNTLEVNGNDLATTLNSLYNSINYKTNDSFSINNYITAALGGANDIDFSLQLPKNIGSLTVSVGNMTINYTDTAGQTGTITYTGDTATKTLTLTKLSSNTVNINLHDTNGFTFSKVVIIKLSIDLSLT